MHNTLHYHSKQIFFLFIGWEPTTWPVNNCLPIRSAHAQLCHPYCVWLQIILCSCMTETPVFSFLWSLFRENGSFPRIFIKKQTWSLNDKIILLNSVIKKYHDLSVSRRSVICLSFWFLQITVHFTVTVQVETRLELTLFWYNPSTFIVLIKVVLLLTSIFNYELKN